MISKDNNLSKYFTELELEEIFTIENLYSKASIIVLRLFNDHLDKSGKPYIGHLYRVANKLDEECEKVAGLLHDTLEDTDITYSDLLEIGFPPEILDIVSLVTKDNIDTELYSEEEKLKLYEDEITRIIESGNIHAIRVKKADMEDNYDPNRLVELPRDTQLWFHKKYGNNLARLRSLEK